MPSLISSSKLIFVVFVCLFIISIFNNCLAGSGLKTSDQLILSAQNGDPASQYKLAMNYLSGRGGLPRSQEKAADWCQKAANQGYVDAQHYLGILYANGVGVQRSNTEATMWFRKAANKGHLDSQILLGKYYSEGRYVLKYNADPQDYVEAMKWFKKASDQGDVDSAFKIACLYKNGLGVPKNDAEATKWFQKAADQGHSYSKKVLFDRIEKGPFYNLPGGKLIDAIYRNDMKTVKEVEITSGLKSLNSGSSLLNLVANKYMYAFNQNWPYCHQREKRRRRFSVTIKEKKYENIYGMDMGSIPSWTSSATYVVPKEFYYLLERLGSNMGSDHMEMAAKYFRLRKVIKIFDGIDILQQTNKCDSPDIKQFEKNLISLTTRSSEWKSPGYIQSNEKKMSQSDVSKPKFAGSWETIVDNQRIEMVLWDKPNKKEQFYGIVYAPNHDCIMVAHLGKHKGKWRLDFGCREASDRKNNCTSNIKGLNKDFFGGFGAAAMDTASDELTLKSNYFLLGYFVAGNVITAPDGKKIKTKIGLRFKRKSISNELLEILKFYKLSGGNPDQKFLDEIKKG